MIARGAAPASIVRLSSLPEMTDPATRVLLTGASGLVGRSFLPELLDRFTVFAVARRSRREAGVEDRPNLHWIQLDIGHAEATREVARKIARQGPVRFVFHFAGYYDFTYEENPEYRRTNVEGTRNVLEMARELAVERVVFASSLAACEFPRREGPITEATPADAPFAYARSKQAGEEMMREYARHFGATVVRLAAITTDWCEYAPLYFFLDTWLGGGWNARILGGRGKTGVTFLHVRDLNKLFATVMERSRELPPHAVYLASPDGTVTHRQLFEAANEYLYGRSPRPILVPKALAYPGVVVRDLFGRAIGRRPFERPWMIGYMDRQLTVDASATRAALGWQPSPRDHVLRRLPFMIEKQGSEPVEWRSRNLAAFEHVAVRPNLVLHETFLGERDELLAALERNVLAPTRAQRFPYLTALAPLERRRQLRMLHSLLLASIRTSDRSVLLGYLDESAPTLFEDGATAVELQELFDELRGLLLASAESHPRLRPHLHEAHRLVTLTLQLARDQVEVAYEEHERRDRADPRRPLAPPAGEEETARDPSRIVDELCAFYQLSPQTELCLDDLKQLLQFMESRKRRQES